LLTGQPSPGCIPSPHSETIDDDLSVLKTSLSHMDLKNMNAGDYIDENLQIKKLIIDHKEKSKLELNVNKAENRTLFTYYWWDNY
jgi:hypothetical protein